MFNEGWEMWIYAADEEDGAHSLEADTPQASTSNSPLVLKKKYVNHLTRRITTYEEERQAVQSGILSVEARQSFRHSLNGMMIKLVFLVL